MPWGFFGNFIFAIFAWTFGRNHLHMNQSQSQHIFYASSGGNRGDDHSFKCKNKFNFKADILLERQACDTTQKRQQYQPLFSPWALHYKKEKINQSNKLKKLLWENSPKYKHKIQFCFKSFSCKIVFWQFSTWILLVHKHLRYIWPWTKGTKLACKMLFYRYMYNLTISPVPGHWWNSCTNEKFPRTAVVLCAPLLGVFFRHILPFPRCSLY